MAKKVENTVEDYLDYPDDNIIPLETKNIIGLEECLSDNITEQQQILHMDTDAKLLSEVTDIKIEDEIISCAVKEEAEDHLDDEVLFKVDANYQLKDYIKDKEINLYECTTAKNFKTDVPDNITSEVKIEDDTPVNSFVKFEPTFLCCDNCNEDYEDYCIKCEMLIYILNGNTLGNINNKAGKEIPNNFLEIKESSGHHGVYTLKNIPDGVKFGPFTGLKTSQGSLKIKGGRFIVDNDKVEFLNWMKFINSTQNILEHNLVVFQNGDEIYYRSTRDIQAGEELLVYFGEKYEISLINDIEMDFIPLIETDTKDVFACTFCCLGFNTMVYLNKHKTICPNDTSEDSSNKDIMQCPYCKIYLEQWEYLEYHMPRSHDEHIRQCVLSMSEDQMSASSTKNNQHEPYNSNIEGYTEHYETKTTCNALNLYEILKQKRNFKLHLNIHEETKLFKCSKCEYATNNKSNFKSHLLHTHGLTKRFKCSMCEFETKWKKGLQQHLNTHEETKRFKCSKCDFTTKFKSSLHCHLKIHDITKPIKCSKCDYATNNKKNLQRHLQTHELTKRFKCSKCNFETKWRDSLLQHSNTHEGTKRFKCSKCDYTTNYKAVLSSHVLDHETIKQLKCSKCDYATNNKNSLQRHLKTHDLTKPFKCSKCDYATNNKSYLRKHLNTHELAKRFKCSKCNFETKWRYSLLQHSNTHEGTKRFKCSKCDYVSNTKQYLRIHVLNHGTIKQLKCSKCDYATNNKRHLQRHLNTHELTKRFKCSKCDYATNNKRNLQRHLQTHELTKRFKCSKCDYATNIKSFLKGHSVSHEVTNQFKCSKCDFETKYKIKSSTAFQNS